MGKHNPAKRPDGLPSQAELDLWVNGDGPKSPRHRDGGIVTERTNFEWVGTPEPYPGAAPWE